MSSLPNDNRPRPGSRSEWPETLFLPDDPPSQDLQTLVFILETTPTHSLYRLIDGLHRSSLAERRVARAVIGEYHLNSTLSVLSSTSDTISQSTYLRRILRLANRVLDAVPSFSVQVRG